MSLRAKYNEIVNGINTFEKEDGFVDYKLFKIENDEQGLLMDIHRIFVDDGKRGVGYAGNLVDEVIEIVNKEISKDSKKIKRLIGHVQITDGMKESSLISQFKYGFKIGKIDANHIILVKDLT